MGNVLSMISDWFRNQSSVQVASGPVGPPPDPAELADFRWHRLWTWSIMYRGEEIGRIKDCGAVRIDDDVPPRIARLAHFFAEERSSAIRRRLNAEADMTLFRFHPLWDDILYDKIKVGYIRPGGHQISWTDGIPAHIRTAAQEFARERCARKQAELASFTEDRKARRASRFDSPDL